MKLKSKTKKDRRMKWRKFTEYRTKEEGEEEIRKKNE
jgi:hypothetical protein